MHTNYPYLGNPYLPHISLPPNLALQASPYSLDAGAQHGEQPGQSQFDKEAKHGSSPGQNPEKDKKKQESPTKNKQKKPMALISFETLHVGTVSSSSGIFNGKNTQFGWSSQSKSNTGFGKIGGHNNRADSNTNVVFDNDQVDTPIDDRDTMWGTVPNPNLYT